MKYYKGTTLYNDTPQGGGSYVDEMQDAHEKYNFDAVELTEESGYPAGEYCLGFVETKSTSGSKQNQLNIEKIDGCEAYKNETEIDGVLVVYCALYPYANERETYVVGWYKNATVYRNYEVMEFEADNASEEKYFQNYNAIAKKCDCVLMPENMRRQATKWKVPRKSKGVAYGFGQSNVWFARGKEDNKYLKNFLDKIVTQIEEYDGENWVDKEPETDK